MSDERAAGIALLSELQAQAYANHEGWRYQLDRERDERVRQLNAWRMSEIVALDRATHPVEGVDSAPVVKKILAAANDPPPPVDIPTRFQNPNDYRILDNLRLRIANTAERTKVDVSATVTLGTLPMGDVEARTWPVKGTGEYVIVVREGVLSFVHVLGKVLLSAMDVTQPDGTTRFTADLTVVAANVASKRGARLTDSCRHPITNRSARYSTPGSFSFSVTNSRTSSSGTSRPIPIEKSALQRVGSVSRCIASLRPIISGCTMRSP